MKMKLWVLLMLAVPFSAGTRTGYTCYSNYFRINDMCKGCCDGRIGGIAVGTGDLNMKILQDIGFFQNI